MTAALALFELRRAAERRTARIALLLFVGALAIGHWDHWAGNGAVNGGGFFGYAYVIGLILLLRFGLAADRQLRFDEYLIANHVSARAYLTAKAIAISVLLVGYGLVGAFVEVVFTGGGIGDALWIAAAWTLPALLLAPLAMLVESWFETSLPSAVVLLLYVIIVMTEFLSLRSIRSIEMLGVTGTVPGDWASLGPLALRTLVLAPLGFLLVGALARVRLPRC